MTRLKSLLPYLIILTIDFYLLPLFIKDTGSAMLMLLVVIPLVCFSCSVLFGIKNPFSLLYPLIVAVLFAPTIFIYYNYTAWVYIVGYGLVALAGSAIGKLFYNSKE